MSPEEWVAVVGSEYLATYTGTRVSKKRVARLMRIAGLAGRCPTRLQPERARSAVDLRYHICTHLGGLAVPGGHP